MSQFKASNLSNPFSTGGGGVDFEHRVQATFLLTLLIDGFSPLLDAPVKSLDYQGKRLGYDTDDLKVTASSIEGDVSLLCQIKHGIKISENDTFKKVVGSAWNDFRKSNFNKGTDKLVLITGLTEQVDSVRFIYDQAHSAIDAKDFFDRIDRPVYSSDEKRETFYLIKKAIVSANDSVTPEVEDLWDFFKSFTILVFDMAYESSVNEYLIQALIKTNSKNNSSFVWEKLITLSSEYNKSAAHVTKEKLPVELKQLFYRYYTEYKTTPSTTLEVEDGFFWSKIALIGSWNEKNTHDIEVIEEYTGKAYKDVQHKLQEESLIYNPKISLNDGIWSVNQRESLIKTCLANYFDNDIEKIFKIATKILEDNDKRVKDDGEFSILTPAEGPFEYSVNIRNGIVDGLGILCNIEESLTSCSDDSLCHCSIEFIREIFSGAGIKRFMSLDMLLINIAEICPDEYLSCLDHHIIHYPEVIEALFPKENSNFLFSRNSIHSILWSLESLAWDEQYFMKCIRILGELASLKYDKTNNSNTPLNSIISIMLPWFPQTLASAEKHKNAVKALQEDNPVLAWKVIRKLLPHTTTSTGGTHRPKYILRDIPDELEVSNKQIEELQQYYTKMALDFVDKDPNKVHDMLSHIRDMDKKTIVTYFNIILEQSEKNDDNYRYPIWKKMKETKNWITQYVTEKVDAEVIELLDKVIIVTKPIDKKFEYKFLYESQTFECDETSELSKWQQRKKLQIEAINDIYKRQGIDAVITFGKEINQELVVANYLGQTLKLEDVINAIELCYKEKIERNFFSSIIGGYIYANKYETALDMNLNKYPTQYTAWVLTCFPIANDLFKIVDALLGSDSDLYWSIVQIRYFDIADGVDLYYLWNNLIRHERFIAAINLFDHDDDICVPCDEIKDVLRKAATKKSNDRLEPHAIRNLIKKLQDEDKDVVQISDIEYIYLPFLDEYSGVRPKMLWYRLANDSEYFCGMIEVYYKKKSEDKHEYELSKEAVERLFKLLYHFSVVPGTDLDGNYHEKLFDSWISYAKQWGEENDRIEVIMQTIGTGLSYATTRDNGLIDEFIMKELNQIGCDEMRRGYYLGILNQRGVVWVDPSGKPEMELSSKYENNAELAEAMGYGRYADTLRLIAKNYRNEAKRNIKRYGKGKE